MAINVPRGPTPDQDPVLKTLVAALEGFQKDYPRAKIDLYRHAEFVVNIRVIDRVFKGKDFIKRIHLVFEYLEVLTDEVASHISRIFCFTPWEVKNSIANLDFEDPIPFEPLFCSKCNTTLTSATAKTRPARAR